MIEGQWQLLKEAFEIGLQSQGFHLGGGSSQFGEFSVSIIDNLQRVQGTMNQ